MTEDQSNELDAVRRGKRSLTRPAPETITEWRARVVALREVEGLRWPLVEFDLLAHIECLEAENARLRAELQMIANAQTCGEVVAGLMKARARMALNRESDS